MNERRVLGLAAGLAIAASVFAVWAGSFANGFVPLDDRTNFVTNPHYRGLALENLRWMFTTSLLGHYVPITWLTLGLDYSLWGMNPAGYHVTSFLFHLANALLFFVLARRLLALALPDAGDGSRLAGALLAALIWAVHPERVESVSWVTERRDVVSGFFALLTVHVWLSAGSSRRRTLLLGAALLLFGAGLLSKGILVALPVALLVIDVTLRRRHPFSRPARAEHLAFLGIALAGALSTLLASRYVQAAATEIGLLSRVAAAAFSLVFYVGRTIVPWGMPFVVDRVDPLRLGDAPFLPAFLAVLAVAGAAWVARRRIPKVVGAFVVYAAFVLPVSGLVQAGPQLVAHRYTYLAAMPLALLVGAGLASLLAGNGAPRALVAGACAILVVALAIRARAETAKWKGALSFSEAAVASGSRSPEARMTLASLHLAGGRWADASADLEAGLAGAPGDVPFLVLLSLLKSTCPDANFRNAQEAQRLAFAAVDATGKRDAQSLFALAAADAEARDFPTAAATAREAAALSLARGRATAAKSFSDAALEFDRGEPHRISAEEWTKTFRRSVEP